MKHPTLLQKIESYLFYEGGSASFKDLVHVTGESLEDVREAVSLLEKNYGSDRGVTLITTESEVSLRTAQHCSKFIETLHKDSLAKEVGPASLEVLGILLYRGKSTQADIDTIRGVNSAFSLRNLRMRGLVQRNTGTTSPVYEISPEALAHLGITNIEDVPNRESIRNSLSAFESRTAEIAQENVTDDETEE